MYSISIYKGLQTSNIFQFFEWCLEWISIQDDEMSVFSFFEEAYLILHMNLPGCFDGQYLICFAKGVS